MSEIKKAFEEFDKDKDNKLKFYELHGALTYLGETTNDDECKALIKKYSDDPEFLSYDPFVQIILDRFSTAENKAAINEAFQTLAPSYPMITEAVISQYFDEDELNFLKKELPPQSDAGGYNAQEWVDSVFNE
uniref:Putative alpha-actinin n=1 Tax=Coptotermes formosanus TaxID=36987 RepID=R4UN27_COPFO|nr:putative alpha-actinin [Coptotermes formosanus]